VFLSINHYERKSYAVALEALGLSFSDYDIIRFPMCFCLMFKHYHVSCWEMYDMKSKYHNNLIGHIIHICKADEVNSQNCMPNWIFIARCAAKGNKSSARSHNSWLLSKSALHLQFCYLISRITSKILSFKRLTQQGKHWVSWWVLTH